MKKGKPILLIAVLLALPIQVMAQGGSPPGAQGGSSPTAGTTAGSGSNTSGLTNSMTAPQGGTDGAGSPADGIERAGGTTTSANDGDPSTNSRANADGAKVPLPLLWGIAFLVVVGATYFATRRFGTDRDQTISGEPRSPSHT